MVRAVGDPGPGSAFDLRAFTASAAGSHRGDLDLASFRDRPLGAGALATVAALAVLERRTTHRLRALLVTPTHKDPGVTAFLATWAYEKHWLADALRAVLEAHPGAPRDAPAPVVAWRRLVGRVAPVARALVTNAVGSDVVALHMSVGALDDWFVQGAYRGLAAREDHAGLRAVLEGLLAVKDRHQAFFAQQARERLAASVRVRVLVRVCLRLARVPVGVDALVPRQRRALAGALVHGEPAAVDAAVDALPGLRALRLGARAAARLAVAR